ncbi:hypothetical protein [Sporosarcina ureae]|nr:hypothetical protein [Sporosarcina ureae]
MKLLGVTDDRLSVDELTLHLLHIRNFQSSLSVARFIHCKIVASLLG